MQRADPCRRDTEGDRRMTRLLVSDLPAIPDPTKYARREQARCACGEPLYDSGKGRQRTMCWECAETQARNRNRERMRARRKKAAP